ncbi:hypothetical protein BU15DRAFT_77821 [Melanogaster broomeanus]|nr:hypothetical protein BU15DRAFT_77821 [Melanogaster broomeanus]
MDTMLVEFAQWIKNHTGKTWIEKKRPIRCLAHVIHLATRALISTYSKAAFYNPEQGELGIPSENGCRDEIGLVAEKKKKADSIVKRKKIDELKLTEEEWGWVKLFTSLLAHADNAQQSFSSDKGPTLQHALPALEALHKAWSKHAEAARYEPFQEGLTAATDKIVDYYERTADSDAYTLIILLDPSQKDVYFKKYWGKELHAQVLKNVEQLFKEKYTQMYDDGGPFLPEKKKGKLPQLLCELSSDEDEIAEEEDHDVDPQSPWLKEFNLYLHSATSIADGLSIVQWWGLNALEQYPV